MNLFDAIYARQSVDRIDSISVESQVEFCKKEVTGESYKVYTDKGYSGKNIDRPAFQDLLRDIEAGKVSRVIVYRLDRISRSVLDFANLIEVFQKNHVDFVSTMEKFDTSTQSRHRYMHKRLRECWHQCLLQSGVVDSSAQRDVRLYRRIEQLRQKNQGFARQEDVVS